MSDWLDLADLPALSGDARARLSRLTVQEVPAGTALFHPGDAVQGFVVLLSGRIEVFLTGPTGRDILLYAVEPGESCVQSTLGLLGGDAYSGEALTCADCRLVLIPRDTFLALMNDDAAFRGFVFRAFAGRMQATMQVLERVAFTRVEARLAAALLERAREGRVAATHAELAVAIGSAREVVSRRLDALERRGVVALERGAVILQDTVALAALAKNAQL